MLQRPSLLISAICVLACAGAHADECAKLTLAKFGHARVTRAEMIPGGSPIKPLVGGLAPAAKADYCRVEGIAKPSADSNIRFEVWIPAAGAWNGKFEQVGNGGYAGAIPYGLMAYVLSLGYAVAGTDDGHQASEMTDASWALHHPEKVIDYGWRAIDETAVASKQILRALTSKAPSKSYFVGCSDGGREALMMAQRFPTYFDGIVAGAPAYAMTRLLTGAALRSAELGDPAGHLASTQLELLQKHALQTCGNGAAYLADPRQCRIDLSALACGAPGNGNPMSACLSVAQAHTAQILYGERKDPATGNTLYGVLPGAEAVKGSWDAWLTGTDAQGHAAGPAFMWNYLAYMVMNDPHLDLKKVTDANLVRGERKYAPIMDADNPDLSAFKAHGGKLIQYHGWNDPGIPPGYSLEYRERMKSKTAGAEDFYRLYMVPGMLHCIGGDAPTQVNWQTALEAWVERAVAPDTLTAADGKGATQTLRPFE